YARGGVFSRKARVDAYAGCKRGDGDSKSGRIASHVRTPARKRSNPAPLHAMSVGIIPILKRKIAMMAATESASAHGLTLLSLGASKVSGNRRTGSTSRNTVWIANQTARLSTTPTTAAVMAERAPLSALLPRSASMNGAPRKIQRKEGMN